MGRKNMNPGIADIKSLMRITENKSLNVLLDCIKKASSNKRERSLEQKIMILKVLQLNDMQYTRTSEETGVSRKALYEWWNKYGETVTIAEPDYYIAETVENNLAQLMDDTFTEARKAIKKMGELIEKTDNPKHLYPVNAAVLTMVDVLKLNKEEPGANKGTFFSDVMKEMFKVDDNGK